MNLERLREVAEDCAGEDRLDLSEPAALLREAVSEIERLRGIIAKCAGASLEWSTGVKSAQEACAEVMSTLMTAAKLPHQPQ